VLHGQVDLRHPARQVEQNLRLAQIEVDVARIQLAYAQLEDAGDPHDQLAALATVQTQLVADAQSQVLGQLATDGYLIAFTQETPGHQLAGDGHDAQVAFRVDAHQCHRGARQATPGDGRAGG